MPRWPMLAPVVALGLVAASPAPQQKGPAQSEQANGGGDQRGTPKAPLIVEVIPAPQTKAQAAREERERESQAATDRNMLVTNIALAVFACLQLVVTAITLFGLKHAKIAAEAADAAADAAKRSVEIATDTAKRQLRAYVTVTEAGIDHVEAGRQPKVRLVLKNSGQTPAHHVTLWLTASERPRPTPADAFAPPDFSELPPQSKSPIAAGEPKVADLDMGELAPEFMSMFHEGRAMIYVYGAINYTDIFGDCWYTTFRMYYDHTRGAGQLGACPEGNDAT